MSEKPHFRKRFDFYEIGCYILRSSQAMEESMTGIALFGIILAAYMTIGWFWSEFCIRSYKEKTHGEDPPILPKAFNFFLWPASVALTIFLAALTLVLAKLDLLP